MRQLRPRQTVLMGLAGLAILIYVMVPTTIDGETWPGIRLDGQAVRWPSPSGSYSVTYGVSVEYANRIVWHSVRLVARNDALHPRQVVLHVENQGAPVESHPLPQDGERYSLRSLDLDALKSDRVMAFEVSFDAAEASRIPIDYWQPYASMPHTHMELRFTIYGHPFRVVIPLTGQSS